MSNQKRVRDTNKVQGKNNRDGGYSWLQIAYSTGAIKSKTAAFDGLRSLHFFINKMEIQQKEAYQHEGKTIPAQKVIRLHGETSVDTTADGQTTSEDKKFCLELPLQDRYRTCNVFLNKLAFVLDLNEQGSFNWDGYCKIFISAPKGEQLAKLFVDFFTPDELKEMNFEDEKNVSFFPYSDALKGFEGVPKMEPLKDRKGVQLKDKDGRNMYDCTEFDQFFEDLAVDLCERVNASLAE